MSLSQPIPFEIAADADKCVASNGRVRLMVLGATEAIHRRRAISGVATRPAAEVLIPQLNRLAGDLLARPETPATEAVAQVLAIAGMVPTTQPQRHEWAVATLNGVRVYTDGTEIIVTTEDLTL